ncbi:PR domain zinc finger protein 10 isoform X2 [Strongylocentrotus purpuratus]|uniref:PR domain zinc finger protein 10 n=1 Tax=Strongylocentrotus purpuratus TaxID=7668 RepID=A0A7M7NAE0_STRPU|nr:PR domain zinc finger protein 10 isoform X2 [Strongylocentrotus purpuratus]
MEADGRELVWPPHAGDNQQLQQHHPVRSPMQHDGVSSSDNTLELHPPSGEGTSVMVSSRRAPARDNHPESPESTVQGLGEAVYNEATAAAAAQGEQQHTPDNEAIPIAVTILPDSSLSHHPVPTHIITMDTASTADQSQQRTESRDLMELSTAQISVTLNPASVAQIMHNGQVNSGLVNMINSIKPEDIAGPSGLNLVPNVPRNRPERKASKAVHQLLHDTEEEDEPPGAGDDRDPVDEEEFLRQGAIQTIADKPIISRARASLPPMLQIFKVEDDEIGVFAKRTISKRTQFGPLEGRIVTRDEVPKDHMTWNVKRNGEDMYIDCADEYESNWMSFIRPASCYSEQNLIAFQLGGTEIYFATIKNIPPRTELRIWYAKAYAETIGENILEITAEEAAELQEKENTWPCFECTRKFRTSELLQKHLSSHDAPVVKSRGRGKRGRPRKYPEGYRQRQRKLAQAKLEHMKSETKEEYSCDYCDKKFPRFYSLQRHLVMHSGEKNFTCDVCNKTFAHIYNRTRHMRRHKERGEFSGPLPPLRRRKSDQPTGDGNLSFACEHCDLEFESKRMLKIHVSLHFDENPEAMRDDGEEEEEMEDEDMEDGEVEEEEEEEDEEDELEMKKEDINHENRDDGIREDGDDVPSDVHASQEGQKPVDGEGDASASAAGQAAAKEEEEENSGDTKGGFICPTCTEVFPSQKELALHATDHGRRQGSTGEFVLRSRTRPTYRCRECFKVFRIKVRYNRHMDLHSRERKKTVQCEFCNKCFLNNSALSVHLKTHSGTKYYTCPFCADTFDRNEHLKLHVQTHAFNGFYTCPHCGKRFSEYNHVRKHIRGFHSMKEFPCMHCHKIFPRPDKLKLHMLRHSNQKDFLCANCGKQFKRKDKLKEHMSRMHNPERELRNKLEAEEPKKMPFKPKIPPSEMTAFTFKCRPCTLGFKRRGMLVNHLAKRHPEVAPDTVPELNLPIVKPNRNYFCAYCEKVYKSSSKRKIHIVKNHPGASVPPSLRQTKGDPNSPFGNPHTAPAGTTTTHYFACAHCPRQYSTKAKMMDHVRKKHMEPVQAAAMMNNPQQLTVVQEQTPVQAEGQQPGSITLVAQVPENIQQAVQEALSQNQTQLTANDLQHIQIATVNPDGTTTLQPILQHISGQVLGGQQTLQVVVAPQGQNDGASVSTERSTENQQTIRYIETSQVPVVQTESVQATDLLTQAMSELSQTINEFRQQPNADYQNLAQRIIHSQPGLLGQSTFQISGQPQTITVPVSIHANQASIAQNQLPQLTVTQAAMAVSQAALGISQPVGQVATTVSASQPNVAEVTQVEGGPQTIDVSHLRQSPTHFQQATQLLQLQSSAQNIVPIPSSIIQAQSQGHQQQGVQVQPGQVEIQVQNQQGQTQQVFLARNWNNYTQTFR